ncbi:ssu ribosomal protein s16p [hydrocarbon metagenome]|uniref:Ssu ribosomal protein s16p n=1 Tax=hydrocarbon metagenome TaxID=938273 RepID=A0A0W8G295_9ZZZZ
MAVKLRLRRMGKKRQPVYKLVAADSRSPRDGRFIESFGLYNPKTEPSTVEINEERALYWLGVGAQPTTTVKNLLSAEGILYKRDLMKRGLNEEEVAKEMETWLKQREARLSAVKAKTEKTKAGAEKVKEKKKEEPAEAKAEEVKDELKAAASEEDSQHAEAEEKQEKSEENSKE